MKKIYCLIYMAEIAIPIAALGFMYILSNKKKTIETFDTSKQSNMELPNTNTPIKNFPIETYVELKDNPSQYIKPNNLKQRYYNPEVHKEMAKDTSFMSLTGVKMEQKDMIHGNMKPFFGSTVKQGGVNDKHEGLLDSMRGCGSQHVKKEARAPLFKPQANLSHIYGAPDQSDFIRSRINKPMRVANVNPFEEKKVGPGLNNGFSAEGTGGFNSGMEARQIWQPKTVDELRVKTNPKNSYSLGGHQGPAQSNIINRGIHGRIEKKRPDTFYLNTPDRWFTTTGGEKAPRVIAEEPLQYQNRPTTTREHFGNAAIDVNCGEAPTQRGNFRETRKIQLNPCPQGPAGCGETLKAPNRDGYKVYPNSRTTTQHETDMGPVQRGLWAVVSPVLDILRPTRKENVVGAARKVGNASGIARGKVWNPADRPQTTIREQTERNKYTTNPSIDLGGGYETNPQYAQQTQKQSMHCAYTSNASAGANTNKPLIYNSAYNANLNPNKQIISRSRLNHGNTSSFNSAQNVRTTKFGINHQAQMFPSMPSNIQNIANIGELSGRNTRENNQINRNNPQLLSAHNNNPYTQSLNSWA